VIALSVALQESEKTVWCLDGDGAALMHMGSLATIGTMKPKNLVHVVLNNEAHESVGGMPTVAGKVDLGAIATACGYQSAVTVKTRSELESLLASGLDTLAKPVLIQVFVGTGSRDELMRPDTTPVQNKEAFMGALGVC
jgi:phosphonopyruvate decarboxylase